MNTPPGKKSFDHTWPMFDDGARAPYPSDPLGAMAAIAPPSRELVALAREHDVPESDPGAEQRARRVRESVPPTAPEWSRAARAMIQALQEIVDRGEPTPEQQTTIARAWAAFTLAGRDETQVLRVAHLVSRTYQALHESLRPGHNLEASLDAAAGVLHSGLPSKLRDAMPLARVALVTRQLHSTNDAWAAIVEATSELLGWKDYARSHAAAVIRSVLERRYRPTE